MKKIIYTVLLLFSLSACSYLPEPLADDTTLITTETPDYITLTTANTNYDQSGVIFYPGGLVDPHAYISLLDDLAITDDRLVIIVKSSANLSILNTRKASQIIEKYEEVNDWIIGGHSLGGSVACMDVLDHPENFDGIFLLASYSVSDLSGTDSPVISITSSNDQVLDQAKFEENETNLPTGTAIYTTADIDSSGTAGMTLYYEIPGGNHAQFGDYGAQQDDGEATITATEQHELTTEMIIAFLTANNL